MENSEKTPRLAIVFDSNMISYMGVIHNLEKKGLTVKKSQGYVHNNYKDLYEIYKAIKDGRIIPVISKSILCEIYHIDKIRDFINQYCQSPMVSLGAQIEQEIKINELARRYTEEYTDEKGKKHKGPFQKQKQPLQIAPPDAIHMAGATVLGMLFVTANEVHYIRSKNMTYDDILYGILTINKQMGYDQGGEFGTPVPIGMRTLARALRKKEEVMGPKSNINIGPTFE